MFTTPGNGMFIRKITERSNAHDVASVCLFPSLCFNNFQYFEAQPPKRLLRSNGIPLHSWCALDVASGLPKLWEAQRPTTACHLYGRAKANEQDCALSHACMLEREPTVVYDVISGLWW